MQKAFLFISLLFISSNAGAWASEGSNDIASEIQKSGNMKYFADSIKHTGLTQLLHSNGPLTVFVPADKAFDKLPLNKWIGLWDDKKKLKQVLSYGVVQGEFARKELTGSSLPTVEGKPLIMKGEGSKIFVGSARVMKSDIKCSNGISHIVDRLLVPPDTVSSSH